MVEHNQRLKRMLKRGVSDPERRKAIRQMVQNFDPKNYPIVPDRSNDDKACSVFGHYCPVFFVNECGFRKFWPLDSGNSGAFPRDAGGLS
jgi:hypothetical protein